MKVLLVHNTSSLLDFYSLSMSFGGITCDTARDWAECITKLSMNDYSLVLIAGKLAEFPPDYLAVYIHRFLRKDKPPLRIALLGDGISGIAEKELTAFGIIGIVRLDESPENGISLIKSFLRRKPCAPKAPPAVLSSLERAATILFANLQRSAIFRSSSEMLKKENEELYELLESFRRKFSQQAESAMILLLAAAEASSHYLRGHLSWVAAISVAIASKLGLSESEINIVRIGGLLHDVGKIGIPDKILDKNGSLDDREMTIIRAHPVIGYRILDKNPVFKPYLDIVLNHHERLDGSGYPKGKKGDALGLHSQIVAVADVFSALTSDRSYRKAFTPVKALEITSTLRGTKLNADCVDALRDYVREQEDDIKAAVFSIHENTL